MIGPVSPPASQIQSDGPTAEPVLRPARPLAPPTHAVAPYLRRLDERRIYSNYGPLSAELEGRVATLSGAPRMGVVTTSSGTAALTAVLRARTQSQAGVCLMPSWTFAATPAAALAAGLTPHFLEVDPQTWALCPEHVAARAKALPATAAIVVVAPFGAPLDWEAWSRVEAQTGAPVVIDAAAAFDVVSQHDQLAKAPPVIVSLHATKALGCGEGGLVLTRDESLAVAVRRMLNFGFHGDRIVREPGFNGKMSEYHAAVALAALDDWRTRRAAWRASKQRLRDALEAVAGLSSRLKFGPDAQGDWATSTFNVVLQEAVAPVQARLAEQGVMTLRWWGDGCADQPAYTRYPADPLSSTRALAQKTLGLPFFCDLTDAEAQRIAETLAQALDVASVSEDATAEARRA